MKTEFSKITDKNIKIIQNFNNNNIVQNLWNNIEQNRSNQTKKEKSNL